MAEAQSDAKVRQIISQTRAYMCIDCSKCTGSCPIGQAGSVYSPRALVQHLLLDGRDPAEADLWRCLTCGLCRQRCPSDVDYPRFIAMLRDIAVCRGVTPQATHGGTMRELMNLMANPGINQSRTAWLPEWVKVVNPDKGEVSSGDIYFVGCAPYFDVVFESFDLDLLGTHTAALELLRAHGVTPDVLANERCCGHDALWSGDTEVFLRLAKANFDLMKRAGAKRVFVSCPEGYYTFMNDYSRLFGDTGIEFVSTVGFLADQPAGVAKTEAETAVTYHDSCRMGRFSGMYDEPRTLLERIDGVVLKEMESSREDAPCCGSNLWINCDQLSKRMQSSLLEAARETGAQVLVTACDKCRIHLACAQMEQGSVTNGVRTENILKFAHGKGVMKP